MMGGEAMIIAGILALLSGSGLVTASPPPDGHHAQRTQGDESSNDLPDSLSARQAVREGNLRLNAGDAPAALKAYRHSQKLVPDAREIAFDEGLAHYDLKQFDQAREAFRKAAASKNDALANDALYSLATCDHAEALQTTEDPQKALSLLENAMSQYHQVLANQPEHQAAREANFKAASMWKQLKRRLKQQQQQSQSKQNKKEDNKKKQDQPSKPKEPKKKQDQQSKQPQSKNKQEQSQPEKKQNRQQQESKKSQEEKAKPQSPKQAQSAAAKKKRVSREQAQRKLREMMQAMRERKKNRREVARNAPVQAVDKDW